MGGAPIVILLVGMLIPIAFLLLAVLVDAIFMAWLIYRLWHDEWSVSLGQVMRRMSHVPNWRLIRSH